MSTLEQAYGPHEQVVRRCARLLVLGPSLAVPVGLWLVAIRVLSSSDMEAPTCFPLPGGCPSQASTRALRRKNPELWKGSPIVGHN